MKVKMILELMCPNILLEPKIQIRSTSIQTNTCRRKISNFKACTPLRLPYYLLYKLHLCTGSFSAGFYCRKAWNFLLCWKERAFICF